MRLVLLGPPGAGKGSLAQLLKVTFDIPHISTGDILREEIKAGSVLGKEAKAYIDNGDLVPDETVTKIIRSKFSQKDLFKNGYLLDGFPRTKQQAEDLDKIISEAHQPLDYALYMETSLPIIIQRLTGRRVCRNCGALYHLKNHPPKKIGICDQCGGTLYQRADDNEETIKTRMDVYLKNTMPIVDYYKVKNQLKKVDGSKETQDVKEYIIQLFHEKKL